MQAIGRARGVRRTAANPVRIVVLAAMALPLIVERVADWGDYRPDAVTVAVAEAALFVRAMPRSPADMVTARPDLWKTAKAAERCLEDLAKLTTPCFEAPQTLILRGLYKRLGGIPNADPLSLPQGSAGPMVRRLRPN